MPVHGLGAITDFRPPGPRPAGGGLELRRRVQDLRLACDLRGNEALRVRGLAIEHRPEADCTTAAEQLEVRVAPRLARLPSLDEVAHGVEPDPVRGDHADGVPHEIADSERRVSGDARGEGPLEPAHGLHCRVMPSRVIQHGQGIE